MLEVVWLCGKGNDSLRRNPEAKKVQKMSFQLGQFSDPGTRYAAVSLLGADTEEAEETPTVLNHETVA